ncbi:MAG: patatin-like phospholipase family protein [Pseudomonadota bacterium]|nr:patatin-like phospholipase family protein [Pseudomonadota bacterium]
MAKTPKVAIGCQGGGSHAAFAAGVLRRLLKPDLQDRFELVALSGTSGGAMCAALAWAGLISAGPADATARLTQFWRDLEVHDPFDATINAISLWLARLPVTAEVSPYLYEPVAEPQLRLLLGRHLGLDRLPADAVRRSHPKLLVGATDIISGQRTIFEGETLGYDDLIASAAVPPLFRAVHAHGTLFWDGLFSTNPPIREFTDLPDVPDEVWVVQINPQIQAAEPRSIPEISNRRNELSGNLALGQELYFIETINKLMPAHPSLRARYKPIRIRVVELGIEGLDYPSKFDRDSGFIEQLLRNGEERALWFFDDRSAWPRPATPPPASRVMGDAAAATS